MSRHMAYRNSTERTTELSGRGKSYGIKYTDLKVDLKNLQTLINSNNVEIFGVTTPN